MNQGNIVIDDLEQAAPVIRLLSEDEARKKQKDHAVELANYFRSQGMTANAVCKGGQWIVESDGTC